MLQTAIFLANGFEEVEALSVVDLLRRAEIEVLMVSVTGKKEVTGAHSICVFTDCLLEELDFKKISMMILPGGMPGTKNLAETPLLIEKLLEFHNRNKDISAICAAPSILGKMGILQGKKACCYPGYENELKGAAIMTEDAVTDGNIITSRGVGTALSFALAIIEKMKGKRETTELARAILHE